MSDLGYELCVIDFGMATTDFTRQQLAGDWGPESAWYAPELFNDEIEHVPGAADVWSVGQLVYQILDVTNLDPKIAWWI